ncbi:MAG: Septum formation protein Maf [Candidatus Heimdallarchaeota archaeon LC_3]|nr:MAG: Septum formation protein Maf [Candidatus Heimdallarchaeota archaeon LC_3]
MEIYSDQRKILLGSASKPRSWALSQIGIPYEIRVTNSKEKNPRIQENISENETKLIVLDNSNKKLENIANKIDKSDKNNFFGILCLDTSIWLPPNNYIAKPKSAQDLKNMLQLMSDKIHKVFTAYSYIPISNNGEFMKTISGIDTCLVSFKKINSYFLENYASNPIALTFAGGYNIQGSSAVFVNKISGDYYTVVGLPISAWLKDLESQNLNNFKELVNSISFR